MHTENRVFDQAIATKYFDEKLCVNPYESTLDTLSNDLCFLAASPKTLLIREQILRIAPVEASVLVLGESGVGKEMVARLIHQRSARRQHPFVKVNCAALPDNLLESELFGYQQGAFTGATRTKPGHFELANQGTIFLDEISEMSSGLQAKLLHVLQDRQYARLGSHELISADARVIAATNANLKDRIQSGSFRRDLYYRLNVLSVSVPALSERAAEVPTLFRHFHKKYITKFKMETPTPSGKLLEAATRYRWPGNVRELENFVKRYVILGDEEDSIQELQQLIASRPHHMESEAPLCERGLKESVRDWRDVVETELIAAALAKTCWNRKKSAQVLGISYRALLDRLEQRGLGRRRPGAIVPSKMESCNPSSI